MHLKCGESSIVDAGGALKEGGEVQMCELKGGGEGFNNESWYKVVYVVDGNTYRFLDEEEGKFIYV